MNTQAIQWQLDAMPGLKRFINAHDHATSDVTALRLSFGVRERPRSMFSDDPEEKAYARSGWVQYEHTGWAHATIVFADQSELAHVFTKDELQNWMPPLQG